ncbi:hypothetical protein BJV82DRAFT_55438 [Fennellomyces sp. T-0311]|nr:hypothetical protein BJV82DRAFT_55438 [Fennellomyces sp. T-0311]
MRAEHIGRPFIQDEIKVFIDDVNERALITAFRSRLIRLNKEMKTLCGIRGKEVAMRKGTMPFICILEEGWNNRSKNAKAKSPKSTMAKKRHGEERGHAGQSHPIRRAYNKRSPRFISSVWLLGSISNAKRMPQHQILANISDTSHSVHCQLFHSLA